MSTDGTASASQTPGGSPCGTAWPPDDPIRLHDTLDAAARAIRPDGPPGPEERRSALQDAYVFGNHAFSPVGPDALDAWAELVSALGSLVPDPPPAEPDIRLMRFRLQQITERLRHHRRNRVLESLLIRLRKPICDAQFSLRPADVSAFREALAGFSGQLRPCHRNDPQLWRALSSLGEELGTVTDAQRRCGSRAATGGARVNAVADQAAFHKTLNAGAEAIFQAEEGNPRSAPRFLADARTAATSAFTPRSRQAEALSVILSVVAAAIGTPG